MLELPRERALAALVEEANRHGADPVCKRATMGFPPACIPTCLYLLVTTDNFEDAIIEVVNLGGDADSTGAILGALLGASYGIDAIPDRWLARLQNRDEQYVALLCRCLRSSSSFGFLWGLIALSNSSLLTFLPACGIWIVWPALRGRAPSMPALRCAALAAACFAAVISPWVVRNERVFHAFVPMRSNFGAELYEATIFSNDGFPWGTTLPTAENAPEFRRYQRLGEIEFSRQQGERARAAIRAHPGLFAANALRRVYFFWIGVPKLDTGFAVEAARRVNFAFFSVSGFLGLALALRRHVPGAWLFFWAFAIYPFLFYFVTVQARFRHPLEPVLCILSVYLFQSADRTRAWSRLTPRADQREDKAKQ